MATVTVAWADDHLRRYGKKIDELNRRFPKVLPRVINQVGNRAKTQVIRKLSAQNRITLSSLSMSKAARPKIGSTCGRFIVLASRNS